MKETIKDLREINRDLLNRVQAGDLKGYLSLQTPVTPESFSIPRTDEYELQQLANGQGLGAPLYNDDDELRTTLSEFGADTEFADESVYRPDRRE